MKEVEFVIPFTPQDRYRHYHLRIKGQVIDFVVQYETFINKEWFPVVRYDNSHGFAHRDLFNIKGQKCKTPFFTTDKNDALTFAENDIKDNWEIYRQRFSEEKKMSERELIEKNMNLSIEFSKYIFEHPELEDKIPKGSQVVLLPEYDKELCEYNLMIAEKQRERDQPVVYVKIKKLLAPRLSRVSNAELEVRHGLN